MRRRQDRSRCPQCGERVTPFAAGCAICGTDLDHRRWDTGPSTVQRAGSWARALTSGPSLGPTRGPSRFMDYVLTYLVLSLCVSALGGVAYAVVTVLG